MFPAWATRGANQLPRKKGRMKFFLDSADLREIETGLSWGVVDGVTTNPTLIAKQGKPYLPTVREIAQLVPARFQGRC